MLTRLVSYSIYMLKCFQNFTNITVCYVVHITKCLLTKGLRHAQIE